MGSSQTRARTHVPRIGRQIFNHCDAREAPTTWICAEMGRPLHSTLRVQVVPQKGGGGIKREPGSCNVTNTETLTADPHHLRKGGCGEGVGGRKDPPPSHKEGRELNPRKMSLTQEYWSGAPRSSPELSPREGPHLKASHYRDHDGVLSANVGRELGEAPGGG